MASDDAVPPPREPVAPEDAVALLQATLDAITEGILVVDENGRIVAFNRSFVSLWGIPARLTAAGDDDALIAFVLEQLQEPAPFVRKVMEVYSNPEAESFDMLLFKDGRRFERRSTPRRVAGRAVGRVWTFRDVTELVRAEEELARAHSLLRATFDATADGILVVDLDGDLLDFNRKVVEMWGIPPEIVTSFDKPRLRAWVMEQVQNPEKFLRKVGEIYREPEGQSYDWVRFKDGRTFERYSMPQKIAGRVVGRVWSFRDVTEQKRLEEELQALRQRKARTP
ncbi:MAG TPA: PAS domain-containing protein [Thermoanaerobaculia bacterium]|nr:PAS domain-containing protein [Thermoanaerobaculia bacterium]